jgi:hypothetical protein
MKRLVSWARYGRPRRHVLRAADWFPVDSWARVRLLDWLYPSDCEITFHGN